MSGFLTRAELELVRKYFRGSRVAGRSDQGVYQQSLAQNFEVGSLRVEGKKKFRYSKAGGALGGLKRLVVNANYVPGATAHENEDGFEGGIGYAAVVGQQYLDVADTALRAANYYAGGYIAVYGVTIFHEYEVLASDAGNGAKVRVYLASPVAVENITAAMGCTVYLNQYSDIRPAGSVNVGFETHLGVPLIPVTINYYFWLQTGGPCIVTPTGGTWPGSAAQLRAVYANPADGTINPASVDDPSAGYQPIGWLLGATVNTYGDLLIDLRLDPS